MKLPTLQIGDLSIQHPIILGAMGVGVTRHKLASAVTNAGGLGVISGVNLGFEESDFKTNRLEANLRALRKEIQLAKEKTKNGIVGMNFMVAMNNYAEHVKEAVKSGIDLIVSGAGLPTELPEFVKNTKTKIAPIVSSAKACAILSKVWDRNHQTAADAVIIEGVDAGGHLGFSLEEIENRKFDAKQCIEDVRKVLMPYEAKYNKKIPIILAGGIYDGQDIANAISYGAEGVQMATRFVTTEECDAHINFKKQYLKATEQDIGIIKSPVGLPGRAIQTPLVENLAQGIKPKIEYCVQCLKTCNPQTTPYCISNALIKAVQGNLDEGLFFAGSKAYLTDKIVSVKTLFDTLIDEATEHLQTI